MKSRVSPSALLKTKTVVEKCQYIETSTTGRRKAKQNLILKLSTEPKAKLYHVLTKKKRMATLSKKVSTSNKS